jgi:hypothetical protein
MNLWRDFGLSLAVVCLGCSSGSTIPLEKRLEKLEPWRSSTKYRGWADLRAAACKLQSMKPNEVVGALDRYYTNVIPRPAGPSDFIGRLPGHSRSSSEIDSVPYLLLRMAFDVPTNATEAPKCFKLWRGIESAGTNLDGTFNVAWPIAWGKNGPFLLRANWGFSGAEPYRASDEYRYFLARYPFRKLK